LFIGVQWELRDEGMTTTLELEIPASLESLAQGRAAVRTWLQEQGVDAVVASDLLAVASEFLLHAIVRAGGVGSVRLEGEHRPDGVRLAVRAAAAVLDAPRAIDLPGDPLSQGSLGRRLVDGCCDDLAITTGDDGATAECWRRTA
jgi:hypothetical protein